MLIFFVVQGDLPLDFKILNWFVFNRLLEVTIVDNLLIDDDDDGGDYANGSDEFRHR